MKQYKILLTADRKQRVAALELMKQKTNWQVGREPKIADLAIDEGEGLWLVGTKLGIGVAESRYADLVPCEELFVDMDSQRPLSAILEMVRE